MKYLDALKIVHQFMRVLPFPKPAGTLSKEWLDYRAAYRIFVDEVDKARGQVGWYAADREHSNIGDVANNEDPLLTQTLLLKLFPIDDKDYLEG